jgi:signal transduction histidine kinase
LQFVSAVCRSHGGSVSVKSNAPAGVCFTLRIPRQPSESGIGAELTPKVSIR